MKDYQAYIDRGEKEIEGKKVNAQELGLLIDKVADNFGIFLSNDRAVDLLRYVWNHTDFRSSEDAKLGVIKDWLNRSKLLEDKSLTLQQKSLAKTKKSQLSNSILEGIEMGVEHSINQNKDQHADIFDWAVETFGPEDIIEKLELEDNGDINLEDHREEINQVYLPSYKEQIQTSDFTELFDRKDPVIIEEPEYDNDPENGNKDECDICKMDNADSMIMAKKAQTNDKLAWVWDDKLGDWKQVPVMSEWDTLMERRLQRQQGQPRLSNRKGQQQLKVGDTLQERATGKYMSVSTIRGNEVFLKELNKPYGSVGVLGQTTLQDWATNYILVPPIGVQQPISYSSSTRTTSSPRRTMPGFVAKKGQTQAQMEKVVPADVTPVNPALGTPTDKNAPLAPGEIPVILEDEEGETVKPGNKTEEEGKKEKQVDLSRENKVKKDVETLRDTIINLANSVYSIEMSDNQVTDLMGKIMGFLSESISEVTLGRVQDIVGDLLPRKASKLSNRKGQTENLIGRRFKYEDKVWTVKQVDRGTELVIVQEGTTGERRYIPFATFNNWFEEVK